MQTGSGAKNPPWARSNVNTNMTGMNPQIMDPNSMMSQQGMMPFQQTQVFSPGMMQAQGGMAMPMAGQMPMNQMAQGQMYPGNVVAYPTPRAMNPGLYQNTQNNQSQSNTEQRVFTGTVTKTHNDFGFVDHDVFYQTSVCAKGIIPKVNDRVLVEATYNPNMPFKWNATRVQVLPKTGPNQKQNPSKSNTYNAVPPPSNNKKPMPTRRDDRPIRRDERFSQKRSRTRSRSRSRDRRDSRTRRDSPPRKRPVVHQPSPVKYVVRVPRMPLDIQKVDVPGLSQRYTNLYIPSDFFNAHVKWGETFPPQMPFSLNNPCAYHIMSREIENPNANDAVLEPPDADYKFSAKVMLISMPTLESLYQKCGLTKIDEKDKRSSSKTPLHPTRLIKFLVGQKGKGGENFAIGGPWSPSLDGENPESDPGVLVKTAIRTCKALTGVDLSSCTQWYRMVEFYYWREGSGGKSRLETVVLFLPDVWSAQPSRVDWTTVQEQYKAACEAAIKKLDGAPTSESSSNEQSQPPAATPAPATVAADGEATADKSQIESTEGLDGSTITIDENDDDDDKPEPTHYSKIDLRTIKVDQLRQELRARNVSCKGIRSQLISRLSKLLKTEEEKEGKSDDVMELEDDEQEKDSEKREPEKKESEKKDEDNKEKVETLEEKEEKKEEKREKTDKEIEEEKRRIEKEKQSLKTRYELPSSPYIIVHPNAAAKGGKFNCSVATLSLLLDYRITDNKEHSFELFVFAELFNEMLMRDFGFYIYKTLYTIPENVEEVKEVKEKSEEKTDKKEAEKKDEKKEEKDKDTKDNNKDKKDEKRDERRDSRKRERRESHSDDERSGSPRRRSRGVDLPPDPYLLLSLVYFDTSRCGYINRKDLQNLFMSLGLHLSRSQIRSILEKVCIKDNFTYKPLVQAIKDVSSGTPEAMQDLPLDSVAAVSTNEVPNQITELELAIAAGNRELLPVFNRPSQEASSTSAETKDVSDTGVVVYKSRVVDVGALVASAARSALVRTKLEDELESTKRALKAARAAAAHTLQAERGAQNQLSDVSEHLAAAKARITSLMASSKIFHSALKSIQAKVEAVVNIKYEDDDCIEVVNGPTKIEKDVKKEKKEADDNADVKEVIEIGSDASTKTEVKEETSGEAVEKENDIISSENMEIDDKE
ncbi:cell division cycle and apoptosis regulator protein 1-like isoform X2 [Hyposmocoma kahamanoa]|uniref:cell division cycle and apoptosis regulator protein 1-like isoform X2 n=1 Tax=Hyposmocoma kahamanoa TaxID=1477025 RepID=UPI000E6D8616|nr:cell division cycle and apoptosis regulator protein 1-like isoform X2 [Hyposmocoma kahamanoa]